VQAIYKIPFWDALIVATMEENSIDTIITENEKDFKKVKWIKTINPFKKAE
jgi:predicted nucleic acid-binding protein